MKELSIEEKAKRYDEALEIAKEINNEQQAQPFNVMTRVFPELKGSEDERIRKAIGYAIGQSTHSDGTLINGVSSEEAIAWLEEQAEHANFRNKIQIGDKVTRNEDGILVNLSQLNRVAKPADNTDKQEEQSPADKVELKFKVGDYVVGKYISGYITEVRDDCYLLDYQGFPIDKQDNYHLWTIQDAKDGDVLSYENEIFIVKKSVNLNIIYYCCYDREHFIIDSIYSLTIDDIDNITPATKEQRDLLFQKMKEAGYEWDAINLKLNRISQRMVSAEAKEAMYDKPKWNVSDFRTWQYIVSDVLTQKDGIGQYLDSGECKKIAKYMQEEWSKKLNIEQKHVELLKGEDYGIDGLYHAINILERTLGKVNGYQSDDGILEHKCAINAVKELYEQKPAWSEEDESMYTRCIGILGKCYMGELPTNVEEELNWLKSLEERVQPQPRQEWSKFDDQMLEAVLYDGKNALGERHKEWIKSLKYRVQPKQEWSEEDENKFKIVINALVEDYEAIPELINWFKSLKDKVLPQSKQEWDEDTQQWIDAIIFDYESWYDADKDHRTTIQAKINILKSLKERHTWKPSDEQMKVLKELVEDNSQRYFYTILRSLYEQLNKLREK